MKKFLGTLFAFLLTFSVLSQVTVKGYVKDKSNRPLPQASVILQPADAREKNTLTNEMGFFEFSPVPDGVVCRLVVKFVGMKSYETTFTASRGEVVNVEMQESDLFLNPLEIRAIRAADKSPFTKTDITKKQLEKLNLGQDIPFLLNQVPSVTITSDAGNGVYSQKVKISRVGISVWVF